MSLVLTAIFAHWGVILLTGVFAWLIWIAGYLRGFRSGQDESDEFYERSLDRDHRALDHAKQQIDFLSAENDAWQRRCRALEGHLVRESHLQAVPSTLRKRYSDPEGDRPPFGSYPPPRNNPPGPKEPPTPPNHKEIG